MEDVRRANDPRLRNRDGYSSSEQPVDVHFFVETKDTLRNL